MSGGFFLHTCSVEVHTGESIHQNYAFNNLKTENYDRKYSLYNYIILKEIEVLYVERNTLASLDNFLHEVVRATLHLGLFAPTLSDIFLKAKEGGGHLQLFQVLQTKVPPSKPRDGS